MKKNHLGRIFLVCFAALVLVTNLQAGAFADDLPDILVAEEQTEVLSSDLTENGTGDGTASDDNSDATPAAATTEESEAQIGDAGISAAPSSSDANTEPEETETEKDADDLTDASSAEIPGNTDISEDNSSVNDPAEEPENPEKPEASSSDSVADNTPSGSEASDTPADSGETAPTTTMNGAVKETLEGSEKESEENAEAPSLLSDDDSSGISLSAVFDDVVVSNTDLFVENDSGDDINIVADGKVQIAITREGFLQVATTVVIARKENIGAPDLVVTETTYTTYTQSSDIRNILIKSNDNDVYLNKESEGTELDVANADVKLYGTSVYLESIEKVLLRVKSLLIEAEKEPIGEGKTFSDTLQNLVDSAKDPIHTSNSEVVISNVEIRAVDSVAIRARQKVSQATSQTKEEALNGNAEDEADVQGNTFDELLNTYKLLFQIDTADSSVKVTNSEIDANSIELIADNTMNMQTYGFFFAGNLVYADSTVEVSNSLLHAREDIIMKATTVADALAERVSGVGAPYGLSATAVIGSTKVDVLGTSKLIAGGNIELLANTKLTMTTDQLAGRVDDAVNGGVVAVTFINFDTEAKVADSAVLEAAKDIKIISQSNEKSKTAAVVEAIQASDGVLGKNRSFGVRAWEAANIVSTVFTGRTVVTSGGTFLTNSLEKYIDAIKEAIGLGQKAQGVDVDLSDTQYSGALALGYTDVTNTATIATSGTVTAGGDLTVEARSSADSSTEADASSLINGTPAENGTVVAQLRCGTKGVPTQFSLVNAGAASLFGNAIASSGEAVVFRETEFGSLGIGHYYLYFTVDDSQYKVKDLDDASKGISKCFTRTVPASLSETKEERTETTYRVSLWLVPSEVAIEDTSYITNVLGEKVIIQLLPVKEEPTKEKENSRGIAISTGITNSVNKATIENSGKVSAKNITVTADDTTKTEKNDKGEEKQEIVVNNSGVKAESGTSTGNVGLSGAIAVNLHTVDTQAYIAGTDVMVNNGAVDITATSTLSSQTTGTGTSSGKESGTGGSVAIGWSDYTTKAWLGSDVRILGICTDLNVESKANVKKSGVEANSGAKGSDDGKGAAIAVNVLKANTFAEVPKETSANALTLKNLTVTADSVIAQKTTTNGNVTNGAFGLGVTIGVDWAGINTKATLSRTVDKAENISVLATGDISDTMKLASTAAGAPKDEKVAAKDRQIEDQVNNLIQELGLENDQRLKVETAEGKVGVAGVAAVSMRHENILAQLDGKTNSTGKLAVKATGVNDVLTSANGGATIQDKGVGVAVSVLYSKTNVDAKVNGEHTTGRFEIAAEMPKAEKVDPNDEDEYKEYEKSSVTVESFAGAGASDTGVAGAVSINVADASYTATVEGKLSATNEKEGSRIAALALREVSTQASGSADGNALVPDDDDDDEEEGDSSLGFGAAFALDNGGINAQATVKTGAVVNVAGDLEISSGIANYNTTTAEAGGDVYEEPVKDGQIIFKFVDGNGKAVKAKIFVWVYEEDIKVDVSNTRGAWMYTGDTIILTAQKGYYYTVRMVGAEGDDNKFSEYDKTAYFVIDKDHPGYAQTIVLTKTGEEVFYNTALDASVAINTVTNNAIARAEEGSEISTGSLTVSATSSSTSEVNGNAEAQSSNNAVGATVALNVIEENVLAELLGSVVTEDLTVTAEANTQDVAVTDATAKGVDLERYERNLNQKIGSYAESKVKKVIPEKYLTMKGNTSNQINDAVMNVGGIDPDDARPVADDAPLSQQLLGDLNVEADERDPEDGENLNNGDVNAGNAQNALENAGNVNSKKNAITFAAAIGVNVVKHTTEATVKGLTTATGDVEVTALNNNDMKTMGDASSVSEKTALSTGVSVVVNNSSATAKAETSFGDIEDEEEEDASGSEDKSGSDEEETEESEEETKKVTTGSVTISADTRVNMSEDYSDAIAAQAIAGSGVGTKEGKIAFAGAVAVVSSNAKTTAIWLVPEVDLESSGDVSVTATEQNKLAARAWAGALQNSLLNDEDAKPAVGDANGVGLACAWIRSNNSIEARLLGNGSEPVNLTASSVNVEAKKLRVDPSAYQYGGFELNGVLVVGSGLYSLDIKINTTDELQSDERLSLTGLMDTAKVEALKLLNYLATRNYYVEAVGGTLLTDTLNMTGISGAGSFAIMDLTDTIESEIGDGITIAAETVKADAESDASIMEVGGAVSYGGNQSAGVVINVVDNKNVVSSKVGSIAIKDAKQIDFVSKNDISVFSISAAAATPGFRSGDRAGAGTIHIINNKPETSTLVNLTEVNTDGEKAKNLNVSADHTLTVMSLSGGLSKAQKAGVGGSVAVTRSDALTQAKAEGTANIRAVNTEVNANSTDTVSQWVFNGGLVTGGWCFEISPSININREKTYAYLNNAAIESQNDGAVAVKAASDTDILNIAGEAAYASGTGIGAAASWTVIDNDTQTVLGSSVSNAGTVDVLANGIQKVVGVAAGLEVSSETAAEGSLGVLSVTGKVLASVDKEASIKNIAKKITVDANNTLDVTYITGSVVFGNSGYSVGLVNTDVITDIAVSAEIGENAKLTGSEVDISAKKSEDIRNMAFAGAAGYKGTLDGAVTTANMEGSAKVNLGKNAHVEGLKVELYALSDAKIKDITGGFSVGETVALGFGVDVANIKGDTKISFDNGAKVIATGTAGIGANAESKRNVLSVVGGADGSANPAIGVSVSLIDLKGATEVLLANNASMQSIGPVAISAVNTRDVTQVAGRAQLGFASAIGAGACSFNDEATTRVKTAETSKLTVGSEGTREFYTGQVITPKDGDAYLEKAQKNGLMVAAISQTDVDAIAANLGAGGSWAIGAGVLDYTDESIVDARALGSVESAGDICVIALNDSYDKPIGGTAEISAGVSVGANVSVVDLNRSVGASLRGNVSAKKDISVQALNKSKYLGIVGGAAIGQFGGVGSVGVLNDTSKTESDLKGNISADGNIELVSKYSADTKAYTGAVTADIYGALGAAVLVQNRTSITKASVAGDTIVKSKDFKVSALTEDKNEAAAVSGGTAVYLGGGVSVNVASASSETAVDVGSHAQITASGEAALIARSSRNYKAGAGNVGIGAAGIGGAVNVLYVYDTTNVTVGTEASLAAEKDTVISAESLRTTDMTAVSFTGGVGFLEASVNVLRIGDSLRANDRLNKALGNTSVLLNDLGKATKEDTKLKEGSTAAANQAISERNNRSKISGYSNTLKLFGTTEIQDMTSVIIRGNAKIDVANGKLDIFAKTSLDMDVKTGGYGAGVVGLSASVGDVLNNSNTLVEEYGQIHAKNTIGVAAEDTLGKKDKKSTLGAKGGSVAGAKIGGISNGATNNGNAYVGISGSMTSDEGDISIYALEEAYAKVDSTDWTLAAADIGWSDAKFLQYGSARIVYNDANVNALKGMLSNETVCKTGIDVNANYDTVSVASGKAATALLDICTIAQVDIENSTLYGKLLNNNTADTKHKDSVTATQGSVSVAAGGGTSAVEKFWTEGSIKINRSTLKSDGKVYIATFPRIENVTITSKDNVKSLASSQLAEARIYGREAHEYSFAPSKNSKAYTMNSLLLFEDSIIKSEQDNVYLTTNATSYIDVNVSADATEVAGIMTVTGESNGYVNSLIDVKGLDIRALEAYLEAYTGYHDVLVKNDTQNSAGVYSDSDAESNLVLEIHGNISAQELVIDADQKVYIEAQVNEQSTSSVVFAKSRTLIPVGDVEAKHARNYTANINIESAEFTTPRMLIYCSAVDGKNTDYVYTKGEDDALWKTSFHQDEAEKRSSIGHVVAILHARNNGFVIDENGDILFKPDGLVWKKDAENKVITITKFEPNNSECYRVTADDKLSGKITIQSDSGNGVINNYSDYLVCFDNVAIDMSKMANTVYHNCKHDSSKDTLVVTGEEITNSSLTINSRKEGGAVQFKNAQILNAGLVLNKGRVVTDNESDYLKAAWVQGNDLESVGSEGKAFNVILNRLYNGGLDPKGRVYFDSYGDIYLKLNVVSDRKDSFIHVQGITSRNGSASLLIEENSEAQDIYCRLSAMTAYKDLTLKTAGNVRLRTSTEDNWSMVLKAMTGKADLQLPLDIDTVVEIYAHTDLDLDVSGYPNQININNGEQSISTARIYFHDYDNFGKVNFAWIDHQYDSNDTVELKFGGSNLTNVPIVNVREGKNPKYRVIYNDGTETKTLCILETTASSVESVKVYEDNAFKIVESSELPFTETGDGRLDVGDYVQECSTLWLLGGSVGTADDPMEVEFIDCKDLDLTVDAEKSVYLKAAVKPEHIKESTVNFSNISSANGDIAIEFAETENGTKKTSKFTIADFEAENITLLAGNKTTVEGGDVTLTSRGGIINVDLNLKADCLIVTGMKATDLELTDSVKKLSVNTAEGTPAAVTVISKDGKSLPADIEASLVNAEDQMDVTLNGSQKAGTSIQTAVSVSDDTKGLVNLHVAGDVDRAYLNGKLENVAIKLEKDDAVYNLTDGELVTGANNIVLEHIGTKENALAVEAAAKDAKIHVQSGTTEEGKGDINLSVSATNEEAGIIKLPDITSAKGNVSLSLQTPVNKDTEYAIGEISGKDITVHADDSIKATGSETISEAGETVKTTILRSNGGKVDFNVDLTADELAVLGMSEADLKVTENVEQLRVESTEGTDAEVSVESRDGKSLPENILAKLTNTEDKLDVTLNGTDDDTMSTTITADKNSKGSLNLHIAGSEDTAVVTGTPVKTTAIIEKEGAALNLTDGVLQENTNNVVIDQVGTKDKSMRVEVAAADATVTAITDGSIYLDVESTSAEAGRVDLTEINSVNGNTVLTLEDPANKDTEYVLNRISGKDITVTAEEKAKVSGDSVTVKSDGGKVVLDLDLSADDLTVSGMASADLALTEKTTQLKVHSDNGTTAKVNLNSRDGATLPADIVTKLVNDTDTMDVTLNGTENKPMATTVTAEEGSKGSLNLHMAGSSDTAYVEGAPVMVTAILEKENGTLNLSDETLKENVNNVISKNLGSADEPTYVDVNAANGTISANAKGDINVSVESSSETAGKVNITEISSESGDVQLGIKQAENAETEYVLNTVSGKDITIISAENAKVSGDKVTVTSDGGTIEMKVDLVANELTVKGMAATDLELTESLKQLTAESTEGTDAAVSVESRDGESIPESILTRFANTGDSLDVTLSGSDENAMSTTVTSAKGSKGSLNLHMAGSKDTAVVTGEPVKTTAIVEKEGAALNLSDDALKENSNNVIIDQVGTETEPMHVDVAVTEATVTANADGSIHLNVESTAEEAGKVDLSEIKSANGDTVLTLEDPANAETEYVLITVSGKDITIHANDETNVTGDRVLLDSKAGTIELDADLTANELIVKGMAKTDLALTENVKQLTVESTEGTDAEVSVKSRDGESLPENILAKLANDADALDVTLNGTDDNTMSTTVTAAEGSKGSLNLHVAGSKDTVVVTGEPVKTTAIIEKDGAALNLSDDALKENSNNVIIDQVGTKTEPMHVDVAVTEATVTANADGNIHLNVESTTEEAGKVDLTEVKSANGDTVLTLEDPANAETEYVLTTVSGKDVIVNANEETNVIGDRVLLDSDAGTIELNAHLKANELTVNGMANTDLRLDKDVKELIVSSGKDTAATVSVESRDGSTLPESVISDLVNDEDILKIRIEGTEEQPIELNVTGTEQNVGLTELTMNGEKDKINVKTVSNLKVVLESDTVKITDKEDEKDNENNRVIMDTVGSKEQPVEIVSKNKDTEIIAEAEGDLYIKLGIETEGPEKHKVELSTVKSENGTASVVATKPIRTDENEDDDPIVYEYHLDAIEGKNVELITEDATVTGNNIVLTSTDPKNGTIVVGAVVDTGKLTVSNMASADLKLSDTTKNLVVSNTEGMHSKVTVSGKDGSIVGQITASLKNWGDKLNVIMSGDDANPMETVIRQKENRAEFTVRFAGDKDKVTIYDRAKVTVYLKDNNKPAQFIDFYGLGTQVYKYVIENILTLIGEPLGNPKPLVIFKLDDIEQITDLKIEGETAYAEALAIEDGLTVIDPDEVIITDNSKMAKLNIDYINIRLTEKLHVILDLKALLNKGMTADITVLYSEGVLTVMNGEDIVLVFELGTLLDDTQGVTTIVFDGDMLRILDGEDAFCEAEVSEYANVWYTEEGLFVDSVVEKMAS